MKRTPTSNSFVSLPSIPINSTSYLNSYNDINLIVHRNLVLPPPSLDLLSRKERSTSNCSLNYRGSPFEINTINGTVQSIRRFSEHNSSVNILDSNCNNSATMLNDNNDGDNDDDDNQPLDFSNKKNRLSDDKDDDNEIIDENMDDDNIAYDLRKSDISRSVDFTMPSLQLSSSLSSFPSIPNYHRQNSLPAPSSSFSFLSSPSTTLSHPSSVISSSLSISRSKSCSPNNIGMRKSVDTFIFDDATNSSNNNNSINSSNHYFNRKRLILNTFTPNYDQKPDDKLHHKSIQDKYNDDHKFDCKLNTSTFNNDNNNINNNDSKYFYDDTCKILNNNNNPFNINDNYQKQQQKQPQHQFYNITQRQNNPQPQRQEDSNVIMKQSRPSVITCASSSKSDNKTKFDADKKKILMDNNKDDDKNKSNSDKYSIKGKEDRDEENNCDPVIEEHFRRSLGTKYPSFSNENNYGSSPEVSIIGSAVLGDTSSSLTNINNRKLFQSSSWNGKLPKNPRPERAKLMFKCIEKGLRQCIALTKDDISLLKTSIDDGLSLVSAQAKVYELEKQYKAAERYLKRLEFQLAKIEELEDHYDIHIKMRDGVRTMAHAYALSSGRERDSALTSVRLGYKECTDTLCAIEHQLESMMGTLFIQMKGLQGFARLCPGDVFEITIKYGDNQKWRTRGKILKNGNQLWESQFTLMKALLGEIITIKAVEIKGLGKNVSLGKKTCETRNLFTATPQLMTINLNSVGTLKLNLILTWNPLHGTGVDTGTNITRKFQSSTSLYAIGSSTLPNVSHLSNSISTSKLGSLPSANQGEIVNTADYYIHRISSTKNTSEGTTTSSSSGSRGSSLHLTGTSGFGSASGSGSSYCGSSVPNSTLTSPESEIAPSLSKKCYSSLSLSTKTNGQIEKNQEIVVEAVVHEMPKNDNDTSTDTLDSIDPNGNRSSEKCLVSAQSFANIHFNVGDTLINLMSSLEDIQGQYCELHSLHQNVNELYRIFKQMSILRNFYTLSECIVNNPRRTSCGSEVSDSVENVLECFDFLDVVTDSEPDTPDHSQLRTSKHSLPRYLVNKSDKIISGRSALYNNNNNNNYNYNYNSNSNSNSNSNTNINSNHSNRGNNSNSKSNSKSNNSNSNSNSNSNKIELTHSNGALSIGSTPSPIDSPRPLTSGSEQLDIALLSHLNYCQRLLENLGSFGPLKKREQASLEKLQNQSLAISKLKKLCVNLCDYFKLFQEAENSLEEKKHLELSYQQKQEQEFSFIREDVRARKIWDTVCYQNYSMNCEEIGSMLICVTSEQFAQTLGSYMKAFLTPHGASKECIYSKVAKLITTRIVDCPTFENDLIVTVFQVALFFRGTESSLENLFKMFCEEISLLTSLHSDVVILKQSMNKLKRIMAPKEVLYNIALLLLNRDTLIADIVENYFYDVNKNKNMREQILSYLLEGLEMDSPNIRQACCYALRLLRAVEYVEQLVYISYADTCKSVRDEAKTTIFSCGAIGRKMYEDSQLFAHGFQGLAVK